MTEEIKKEFLVNFNRFTNESEIDEKIGENKLLFIDYLTEMIFLMEERTDLLKTIKDDTIKE